MTRFHVIIPAAGSGSRMGADTPKQYLLLNGQPLIEHVIQVFNQAPKINSIHIVLSEGDTHWRTDFLNLNTQLNNNLKTKAQVHYCGGDTRASTVLNALKAIESQVDADDWVLVHDAARPGLSSYLLNTLLSTLENDAVGGLLALPLADTLKRADSQQCVAATVPRADLWQAQTPQMFRYSTLKKALTAFAGVPTDEAEAIEALGLKPKLVLGALQNLKVTYPQDLVVLAALLNLSHVNLSDANLNHVNPVNPEHINPVNEKTSHE